MTKILKTAFADVKLFQTKVFDDPRGSFTESYNERVFSELLGKNIKFIQDNLSFSHKGVIRGLHYQLNSPQGKLLRVISGTVLDVIVDIRKTSPQFGQHIALEINSGCPNQIWIPPGFAHGFQVLSKTVIILYKLTNYWDPLDEHCLLWNDPDLNINWVKSLNPIVSKKDSLGKCLSECQCFD